jgi:hypothetical protein
MGLIILAFLSLFSFGMYKLYRWNVYTAKLLEPYQDPDEKNSAVSSTTVIRTQIY